MVLLKTIKKKFVFFPIHESYYIVQVPNLYQLIVENVKPLNNNNEIVLILILVPIRTNFKIDKKNRPTEF